MGVFLSFKSVILYALAVGFAPSGSVHAADLSPKADVATVVDRGLTQAIDRAVHTHPSVDVARAGAQAAGVDVYAARWQRFPTLSVEGLLLDQSTNKLQAQAVVDQPIWTAGRISGSIDRASARENASLAAYDEAVLAVALSTSQAFFDVYRLRERAKIISVSLQQHNSMVETMQRRVEQQVSPSSDLDLARARALQIEQEFFQVQAQERSALSRLREWMGDAAFDVSGELTFPTVWPRFEDSDVLNMAIDYSPQLRRLSFESESAKADVQIAKSVTLPQLSAQYSYSEALGNRFGLVLKLQSEGGLSKFSEAEATKIRAQSTQFQHEVAARQLRDQLFSALREYDSFTKRIVNSASASESTKLVMESYMRQFTSGRRTWLDVMNAVRESTAAETDALDVRVGGEASLVRILLLSGQWIPESREVNK